MSRFKVLLPAILITLFEIAIGVMLIINPVAFTRATIIILGVLLLILGIIFLVRFIKAKKAEEGGVGSLVGAIVALILGLIFTAFSGGVLGVVMNFLPVVYAVILLIFGINKIVSFFVAKNSDHSVSWLNLISGAAALVLSIVIIFYPAESTVTVWIITGIGLLVEAAFDIIAIIHTAVLMKKVNF